MELFDRGLKNAIDSFEKAREWADLSNCLQKTKQNIEKHNGLQIPRQRELAKRLAQCLNPEINVIHQLTLDVYKVVFEREISLMREEESQQKAKGVGTDKYNYDRKSSVALFFSGLFNFYQFAAFEVKQSFLDLVQSQMLSMKKEIILSLPGFMLCMLPALEEQNSEILKKVEKILAETEKIVGTSEFFGEIWKAMLRTPRARLPAIKYLDKRIPRNIAQAKELADKKKIHLADYTVKIANHEVVIELDSAKLKANQERIDKLIDKNQHNYNDFFYFYYPNKQQLVINALIQGLQLNEINYVNRATLDFLISHMPLKDENINTQSEKISLLESASLTYTNRDFATLNKLQHWLFEQFDDEQEIQSDNPTVLAIVESQKLLLKESMEPKIKERERLKIMMPQKAGRIGHNDQINHQEQEKMISNPILILLRIMSDENEITVPILSNISIDLLNFIKHHLPNIGISSQRNQTERGFRQNLKNFLEHISPQYHAVLEALAKKLQVQFKEINNIEQIIGHDYNLSYKETIEIVQYAIFDMKNLWPQLLDSPNSQHKLIDILSTMLNGLSQLSGNNKDQDLQVVLMSLQIIDRILETFQQMMEGGIQTLYQQKDNQSFNDAIMNFNKLYVQMCEKMISDDSLRNPNVDQKLEMESFVMYNKIIMRLLPLQFTGSSEMLEEAEQMPPWLDLLIKCAKCQSTGICLVAVEVFLHILEHREEESAIQTHQNRRLSTIQKIQSFIAGAPIKVESYKLKKMNKTLITDKSGFREAFHKMLESTKIEDSHCRQIIQNLWSQLDAEVDTAGIVKHLRAFDTLIPKVFSDVVIQDLNPQNNKKSNLKSGQIENQLVDQDRAIKKFTVFWKHTQAAYTEKDTYKPFAKRGYKALHNMLKFLEDPDPTLRLSCRSWLSQSSKQYNRIIDPLIEEFIQNSKFLVKPYISEKGGGPNDLSQVFIVTNLEHQQVIENFGKLRNIILNAQEDIIEYMVNKNVRQDIRDQYEMVKTGRHGQNQPEHLRLQTMAQLPSEHNSNQFSTNQSSHREPNVLNLNEQFSDQVHFSHQAAQQIKEMDYRMMRQDVKYLDMLVEITLRFIQAESEEFKKGSSLPPIKNNNLVSETPVTVNASACEFMELILKQVQRDPTVACRVAHTIARPLILTLNTVVKRDNYAMMVNIINLLDLILNECNFQAQKQQQPGKEVIEIRPVREDCGLFFTCEDHMLLKAIQLGLSNSLSFVRHKFIKFVEMLIPYMRKFVKENENFDFVKQIKFAYQLYIEALISIFCQLLHQVDVGSRNQRSVNKQYSEEFGVDFPLVSLIPTQAQVSHPKQIEKEQSPVDGSENIENNKISKLIINQENDIVQIIQGLQSIINSVLDIKFLEGEQLFEDNEVPEEDDIMLQRHQKNEQNKNQGLFGSLFGGGESTGIFQTDMFQDARQKVHEKISEVIVACVHSWNQLSLFEVSNFNFTRHGMFTHTNEDTNKMNNLIKDQRINYLKNLTEKGVDQAEALQTWSFEKLLQIKLDYIQKRIIALLRPIAKKYPDQFIEGMIKIWLHSSRLQCVDINKGYQKVIQMLICVYQAVENSKKNIIEFIMPPYKVIDSLTKYIQDQASNKNIILINNRKYPKNNALLSPQNSASETLLCSFVYAYLAYNPTMYDPLFDRRPEDKSREFHKVYISMVRFFNLFKLSKNPFTICWLLELLNILMAKFKQEDARLDTRQRKEIFDILNGMFLNCSQIIGDSFNINFDTTQKYKVVLSPTVYELLFRFEYIWFSQMLEQNKDSDIFGSRNSPLKRKSLIADRDASSKLDIPLFFTDDELRKLLAKKFEYMHSDPNSIFKNMEILLKDQKNLSVDYQKQYDFLKNIKQALRGNEDADFLAHTKFYVIVTLKQLLVNLCLTTMTGLNDTEKANKLLNVIFTKVIEQLDKNKKGWSSEEPDKVVFNEFLTEFFAWTVDHLSDQELIKPYRKNIIEQFNKPEFFHHDNKIFLRQWQKVMKVFFGDKPDEILQEQMQIWNTQPFLLHNSTQTAIQKCYAMKKIAFLIFSCNDDEFQSHLDQLMKKMIEVFKTKPKEKNDLRQRLFLFFLTRVLLIRLNYQTLTEALRKLWPHLVNELITVFEDDPQDRENTELVIECIKLVELLSSLNIEDFQMNQWIFLIDGYGMKEVNNNSSKVKAKDVNKSKMGLLKPGVKTEETNNSEMFKTFIVKFLGDKEFSFYNVDVDNADKKQDEDDQIDSSDNPFKLNPVKKDFDPLTDLQTQAVNLQMNINDSNVKGNEFNRQEAEAKIEEDFIVNEVILTNMKGQKE